MQNINLRNCSEMVAEANYDAVAQTLLLTYQSGNTTIAYQGVPDAIFRELCQADYPDLCIRFKIQASHPFKRVSGKIIE